jgi:hypothetical protein
MLGHLPKHTRVTVSFRLFVLRSWDGNNPDAPDLWSLRVDNGPVLVHTSFFNNTEQLARSPFQAFPGRFPSSHFPGRTSARENNTLGYSMTWDGTLYHRDAVYPMTFTFAHSGPDLALDFTGLADQEITDESWGLADVRVSVDGGAKPGRPKR